MLTVVDSDAAWDQLASLARVEVYQATGMVMAQLGVGPAEALVRLRAHAFVHGLTASEVAWSIVGRQLSLESDDERPNTGRVGGAA
jgi:AmiR/NasT family two-component response regulator